MFAEQDYLQLSGLQHFAFCRRQWALIHIENQWAENLRTIEGGLLHERAHDPQLRESRGDTIIMRAVAVHSPTLGISGQCDVVEYRRNPDGVPLRGRDGLWQPYPIEYKHGVSKVTNEDRLQLCAQAMCLEDMLCCTIEEGALYYGGTHRREPVSLTPELRAQVRSNLCEMHDLFRRGYTPVVKPKQGCKACSLKEICLPKILKRASAAAYLSEAISEEP